MTTATVALFLAVLLALGYKWHRREVAHAAERTEHAKVVAVWSEYHQRETDRLRTMLASAESDIEWARIVLADVARERDMYQTAFTAVLRNQARGELLRPDDAHGLATVHEIRAGRA